MPVEYRKGNIFQTEIKVIGHGCNCVGSMGAGIAKQIAKKYPALPPVYYTRCKAGLFKPGSAWLWSSPDDGVSILNLGTQFYPGADAKIKWIRESLENTLNLNLEAIAIPKIGCGFGGLVWEEVKEVIEEIGSKTQMKIVVYEL